MCIICVDFQKQRMTLGDAKRAYGEMVESLDPDHAKDVREMLADAAKSIDLDEKLPDDDAD